MRCLVSRERDKRWDPIRKVQLWCGAVDTVRAESREDGHGFDGEWSGEWEGPPVVYGKPFGPWETTTSLSLA